MRVLVVLSLLLSVSLADSSDKQEIKPKPTPSSLNTVSATPKQEIYYQMVKYPQQPQLVHHQQILPAQLIPQSQGKPQLIPIQLIPKPYYVHQAQHNQPQSQPQYQSQYQPQYQSQFQPQAMIIIAQPALVPSSLVYGSATQQLLNYFHSNPQAKYQLLQGNYAQVQPQQLQVVPSSVSPHTFMQHLVSTPNIGNLILTPSPQYQHTAPAAPAQLTLPHASPYSGGKTESNAVEGRYSSGVEGRHSNAVEGRYSNGVDSRYSTTHHNPPRLSQVAHLAQLAAQQYATSPLKNSPAIVTGFENFTPDQQAQIKAQLANHLGSNFHAISSGPGSQYSSKYQSEQQSDFVPSPQMKSEVSAVSAVGNTGTGDIMKTQYTKG